LNFAANSLQLSGAVLGRGFFRVECSCRILFGVVIGNLIGGIPLGADKEFHGTFLGLLHPYALLTGVMVVAVCMMQGAIYIVMKTEGRIHNKARGWVQKLHYFLCYLLCGLGHGDLLYAPQMVQHFKNIPYYF